MFKIGDLIVYSDGKIYEIVEATEKDYGRGPQQYFILKQKSLLRMEFLLWIMSYKPKIFANLMVDILS